MSNLLLPKVLPNVIGDIGRSISSITGLLFSFAAGDPLPSGSVFTGPAGRTYFDASGVLQTAGLNTLRDGHYIGGVRTVLLEGARTMYFANSGAPATQTSPALPVGTYTLWMVGTGSIAVAQTTATITGAGTATAGAPVTFAVTATGTVTFTVTGSPTRAQCELGAFASSYFATTTVPATRAADSLALGVPFGVQGVTVLGRYTDLGTQAASAGIYEMGNFTTRPAAVAFSSSATAITAAFHNGTAQVNAGAFTSGVVSGDILDARLLLRSSGAVQLGLARNGGAETLGAASAGQSLGGPLWGGSTIKLNQYTGSAVGFAAFHYLKVAAGVRSLVEMRGA